MATDKKIDVVILGLLSHEDLTGYEIKKRIDTTLKYFWSASFGSIYPALGNLVERNLAVSREEADSNRGKIVYSITDEGREYLKDWLERPVVKDELRYETLLKLFFGHEGGRNTALEHIERFEEKTRAELNELRQALAVLESVMSMDETHKYYYLTAKFGVKSYETYLEWCEEARKLL